MNSQVSIYTAASNVTAATICPVCQREYISPKTLAHAMSLSRLGQGDVKVGIACPGCLREIKLRKQKTDEARRVRMMYLSTFEKAENISSADDDQKRLFLATMVTSDWTPPAIRTLGQFLSGNFRMETVQLSHGGIRKVVVDKNGNVIKGGIF